jgi:hypothetical protein
VSPGEGQSDPSTTQVRGLPASWSVTGPRSVTGSPGYRLPGLVSSLGSLRRISTNWQLIANSQTRLSLAGHCRHRPPASYHRGGCSKRRALVAPQRPGLIGAPQGRRGILDRGEGPYVLSSQGVGRGGGRGASTYRLINAPVPRSNRPAAPGDACAVETEAEAGPEGGQ